jgi:hypothetical protein
MVQQTKTEKIPKRPKWKCMFIVYIKMTTGSHCFFFRAPCEGIHPCSAWLIGMKCDLFHFLPPCWAPSSVARFFWYNIPKFGEILEKYNKIYRMTIEHNKCS